MPTQDQQLLLRTLQWELPPDQQLLQTPESYSPYQRLAETPAAPRRMAPQSETPPTIPYRATPQQSSPPLPQFPATRPVAPPAQTATGYPIPAALQPPVVPGSAFLSSVPMGFRPTPQDFPAIQQPAPMFTPNGYYAPLGVPKYHLTRLLVAPFSVLILLIGMVVIPFINNQSDSTTVPTDYKNEGWKVSTIDGTPPPVVIPENNAEAKVLTENNPLYNTSLESPVRCDPEPLLGGKQKDEELEANLQVYLGCLTRVWGPTLEKVGYRTFQPKTTVSPEGGAVTTEYEKQKSQNAFYCVVDQRIYIAQDILDVLSIDLSKARAIFNLITAHEYGYTIQGQSGILVSGNALVKSGNDSRAMEISRCLEAQADCFAGAAMGPFWRKLKLTDAGRQNILNIIMDLGDDKLRERNNDNPNEEGDHGKDKNRHTWLERRLNSNGLLGQCNTLAASSGEVE